MTRQRTGSRALGGLGQGSPGRGGLMTLAFLSVQGPETVIAIDFGIACRRGLVTAETVLFGGRTAPIHWRLAGGVITPTPPLAGSPCWRGGLLQGVVQTRGTLSNHPSRLIPSRLIMRGRGGPGGRDADQWQRRVSPLPPRGYGNRDPVIREGMDLPRGGPERHRGDQDQQQGLLHISPFGACSQARLLLAVSGGNSVVTGAVVRIRLEADPAAGGLFLNQGRGRHHRLFPTTGGWGLIALRHLGRRDRGDGWFRASFFRRRVPGRWRQRGGG